MKRILLLGTLLLAIAALVVYLVNPGEKREKPAAREIISPEAEEIAEPEIPEEMVWILEGEVVPAYTQTVSFKVSGLLEMGESDFQQGSKFHRDQLLFQVNNSEAFIQLQEAKQALKEKFQFALPKLMTNLLTEKAEWEAYIATLEPVSLTGELPELEIPEERQLMNTLRIPEEHEKIKSMEARMADYFYLAPFDGTVTEKIAHTGQKITAGQIVARIAEPGKWLIKSKAGKDVPEITASSEIQVMNLQKEIIGEGKYVKSAKLKDGTSEIYFTLEKGKRVPRNEVFIEIRSK